MPPREGRSVRGRALRSDGARDVIRSALHASRRFWRAHAWKCSSSGFLRSRARRSDRRASHRDRCPRHLVTLDLDVEWTVTEAGFRSLSANSWAHRETLRSASSRPSPTDGWCSQHDRRFSFSRRNRVSRPLGRRAGCRLRRSRVTTAMTGYQETLTDPSYAEHSSASPLPWSATTVSPRSAASSRGAACEGGAHALRSAVRSGQSGSWSTARRPR